MEQVVDAGRIVCCVGRKLSITTAKAVMGVDEMFLVVEANSDGRTLFLADS